jgi:N-acetylglucosaminyl-diphospho-decaprenol L-rhamnosyltransferase
VEGDSLKYASRVRVVTISFHSETILPEMLKSLPTEVEVVVVDNAESTTTAMQALHAQYKFKYLPLHKNKGFGAACNEGAKGATTDFLFFLNPDAKLTPGSLHHLIQALDNQSEVSAANPLIRGGRGKIEFKYRSVLLPRQEWRQREIPKVTCDMPALTGSALLVRRHAFCEVGGFDENIFLYHEDDDLSIRLRRQIGPLLFVPQSMVEHHAGHSSGRSPQLAFHKAFHKAQSRIYAMRKHNIPRASLKTLTSALIGLLNPSNFISRRKRLQSWGFLMGSLKAKHV